MQMITYTYKFNHYVVNIEHPPVQIYYQFGMIAKEILSS